MAVMVFAGPVSGTFTTKDAVQFCSPQFDRVRLGAAITATADVDLDGTLDLFIGTLRNASVPTSIVTAGVFSTSQTAFRPKTAQKALPQSAGSA